MCLIVDNNKCGEFFKVPRGEKEQTIVDWVAKKGRIVVGGKLRTEMLGNRKMRAFLSQLKLSGRLKEIDDSNVNSQEVIAEKSGLLSSNDPHVIALALVSGARLLHTSDEALIDDFKNPKIVNSPRGKIFNGSRSLLLRSGICPTC